MRCVFCNEPVNDFAGCTVPGLGPAHTTCLDKVKMTRRIFRDIDLTLLNDDELSYLLYLVNEEVDTRQHDVDLF